MIGWFDAEDTYRDNPALREPFQVLHQRARRLVETKHPDKVELMKACFPMYWGDQGQIAFPRELAKKTGIPAEEIAAAVRAISKEIFDDWRSTKEWAEIEAQMIERDMLTPEARPDEQAEPSGSPCPYAYPVTAPDCTRAHLARS